MISRCIPFSVFDTLVFDPHIDNTLILRVVTSLDPVDNPRAWHPPQKKLVEVIDLIGRFRNNVFLFKKLDFYPSRLKGHVYEDRPSDE